VENNQQQKPNQTKKKQESSGWQKFHLLKSLSRVLAIVPLPLANIFVMSGNFSRVCHDNCNCSPALFPISKQLACNSFAVYTAKDNLSWHNAKLSATFNGNMPQVHKFTPCHRPFQHFPATQL